MKYGKLVYTKRNDGLTIGDDMQLLGIENLYNYMGISDEDILNVDFHELKHYDGESVILPISFPLLNYSEGTTITCYSEKIIPVFLGVCILANEYCDEDIAYLKRFEPIGCRDQYTYDNMRKNGIDAYVNTCMTLALPRVVNEKDLAKREKIFCIDVNGKLKEKIPETLLENCEFVSHTFNLQELEGTAEDKCREIYNRYIKEARLIITDRLHGALPCAAAGIPVIFAKDKFSWRFTGIDKVLKIYTEDEYDSINWNPKPYYFEDIKKLMLENAAQKVVEAYKKYNSISQLNDLFIDRNRKGYFIEFLTGTFEYINSEFRDKSIITYSLWGVTQVAEAVHSYIQKKFPQAQLVAVVDRDKRVTFCGIQSGPIEQLLDNKESYVFVTASAAIRNSQNFFKENKITKYYQCCLDNLNYKK